MTGAIRIFCVSIVLWAFGACDVTAADTPSWHGGTLSAAEFMEVKTIRLWDARAPGARGDDAKDIPTLTVFRPARANGTAVIVLPGGSYVSLAAALEGREIADWFSAHGITAFVLKYRLAPEYALPIPLLDAQRAVRLLRARSDDFQISKGRIGVIGFSAGGHLAALTGTLFDQADSRAGDPIDRESDRPDFLVLGYPAIEAYFSQDADGKIAYCAAAAIDTCNSGMLQKYLPARHVSSSSPPTFLYQTSDDPAVPYEDPIMFYRALRQAGVPAEIHIFEHGPHGTGLGSGDPALDNWPLLLEGWLRGKGLLTQDPTVIPGADIPPKSGNELSIDTGIGELLENAAARKVLVKHLGSQWIQVNIDSVIKVHAVRGLTLRHIAQHGDLIDAKTLRAIAHELATLTSR